MASFGRLQASAFSAVQDTTVALANINFDFSLYKVEAPLEYEGLGRALTRRRRDAAESGSEHVFARRLGALFAQLLPNVPHLIKTYGERASEIAQLPQANPEGSRNNGPFQEFAGVDGTSIWAAATSGQEAIAVHLLACMLARQWPADEAVAIWEEIIERRKQEIINADPSGPLHLPTLMASRCEVTRNHMESWDASARSWLAVADRVKVKEQTQLMLLIQKAGLAIRGTENIYTSVLTAWQSAMTTIDNVISGMPHQVQEGAALLGLASWHIYPDLFVLEADSKTIAYHDSLVAKGGIVTLGAVSYSPDNSEGVSWSLPLACLTYYGNPVTISREIGEGVSRLNFLDFSTVVLGIVFSVSSSCFSDLERACRITSKLWDLVAPVSRQDDDSEWWLYYLAQAAKRYLCSSDVDRQFLESLIRRGSKHHCRFLAPQAQHPKSLFGIGHGGTLQSLCKSTEHEVHLLELALAKLCFDVKPFDFIIRYPIFQRSSNKYAHEWGFVTVSTEAPKKRKQTFESRNQLIRRDRQAQSRSHVDKTISVLETSTIENAEGRSDMSCLRRAEQQDHMVRADHDSQAATRNRREVPPPVIEEVVNYRHEFGLSHSASFFKRIGFEATPVLRDALDILESSLDANLLDPKKVCNALNNDASFLYCHSLAAFAAAGDVYQSMPFASIAAGIFSHNMDEMRWNETIPPSIRRFKERLGLSRDQSDEKFPSLIPYPDLFKWVTSIKTYITLTLTLTLETNERQIVKDEVSHDLSLKLKRKRDLSSAFTCEKKGRSRMHLNRAQTWACIAMFENRECNLDPKDLTEVMAITSGNSIFMARPLACDPLEEPQGNGVRHITGNTGHPGVNLLVPPRSPKVKKQDEDNWILVNHRPFDGRFEDSFRHTSMHLSFTKYKLPVIVTNHGYKAVEAHFIEALVSISDRGKWIADLNVLKALESSLLKRSVQLSLCSHSEEFPKRNGHQLSAIELWDEFLDGPPGDAIFKTSGNWQARLAACVLSVQSGYATTVFNSQTVPCFECLEASKSRSHVIYVA